MTLTLLSLPGLQPDFFPALATEPLSVCAMIANRYNPFSYMAAFFALFSNMFSITAGLVLDSNSRDPLKDLKK